MKKIALLLFAISIITISMAQNSNTEWMKTNLKVTTFRNGDTLFYARTKEQWQRAEEFGIPAYCTSPNLGPSEIFYNWFAVNDPKQLAPSGYRMPSKNDFQLLINSGQTLKSNVDIWQTPETNPSTFNAFPYGFRSYDGGDFYGETFQAFFWATDKGKTQQAFAFYLPDEDQAQILEVRRGNGYSIRCIRNKKESIAADRIVCKQDKPIIGQVVNLTVEGGELSDDATWIWYQNTNTNEVGKGKILNVKVDVPTRFFVRASNSKSDDFVSIIVNVTDGFIAPTISAPQVECIGKPITLSLIGGELGSYSEWIWYSSKGNSTNLVQVGKGTSLSITPSESTTYSVRPEKSNGDAGKFTTFDVTMLSEPKKADKIEFYSPKEICEGEYAQINIKGTLPTGSEWIWEVNGKEAYKGNDFNQKLYINSEISVYARNLVCANSSKINATVKVFKKSIDPEKIIEKPFSYNKTKLYIEDGVLGDGANWNWYKTKPSGKEINLGSRSKIIVKNRKPANYRIVAANGKCISESNGTSFQVKKEERAGKFTSMYAKSKGIFHVGLTFGYAREMLKDSTRHLLYTDSSLIYGTTNNAFRASLELHPIINEYFTLGFRYTFQTGNGKVTDKENLSLSPGDDPNSYAFTNKHKSNAVGADLLFSMGKRARLKVLMEYELATLTSVLTVQKQSSDILNRTNTTTREVFGLGFRIGSYGKIKESKKTQLDLLYTFTSFHSDGKFDFTRSFFQPQYANQAYTGVKARIWMHNTFRLEGSMLFNTTLNDQTNGLSVRTDKSMIYLSLVFSLDSFY